MLDDLIIIFVEVAVRFIDKGESYFGASVSLLGAVNQACRKEP